MFRKDAMACSEDAFGKGKECPRDGEPDCSIVDAFWYGWERNDRAGKATKFLSWTWCYRVCSIGTYYSSLYAAQHELSVACTILLGENLQSWVKGLVR